MQKGVITFEDLHEGMKVTGKIKNVVDFGAFVDLGIKETALVHISELSDSFVKDPMSIVKVGDVIEFRIIGLDQDRRRISLSRKSGEAPARTQAARAPAANAPAARVPGPNEGEAVQRGEKRPVLVARKPGEHSGGDRGFRPRPQAPVQGGRDRPPPQKPRGDFGREPQGSDDGTMYNPFAAAFKKMQEKKKS